MYGQERLSRDWILERVSQEEIMSYYLGVPVQFKQQIKSPLRADNSPTCSFSIDSRGTLIFKDFSGHFYGDCFNVVEYKYGLSFTEAFQQIAADFRLRDNVRPVSSPLVLTPTKAPTLIEVGIQKWTSVDKAYWQSFGITSSTLSSYQVTSIAHAWVDNRLVYSYRDSDPGYCYGFENVKKLYFPLRTSYRFLSSGSVLQGLKQLPETGKLLVLTKSLKDVMLLYQYGIAAAAPSSENSYPSEQDINTLKARFETIVSFYDFDYAGIKGARKLRKLYQIQPLFLTNGRFKTPNYQAKDLTDFRKQFGEEATSSLIYALLEWQTKANEFS